MVNLVNTNLCTQWLTIVFLQVWTELIILVKIDACYLMLILTPVMINSTAPSAYQLVLPLTWTDQNLHCIPMLSAVFHLPSLVRTQSSVSWRGEWRKKQRTSIHSGSAACILIRQWAALDKCVRSMTQRQCKPESQQRCGQLFQNSSCVKFQMSLWANVTSSTGHVGSRQSSKTRGVGIWVGWPGGRLCCSVEILSFLWLLGDNVKGSTAQRHSCVKSICHKARGI